MSNFSDSKMERTVDDIFAEIDQIDITKIEPQPEVVKYFETVQAYFLCFNELEAVYNQVDPTRKLTNYDMPDFTRPIRQLYLGGEPVKNFVELYEVAEIILPVFVAKVENLMGKVATMDKDSSCNVQFRLPPGHSKLKGKQRASEKAEVDYSKKEAGPPESWLHDIVRGSVMFDNTGQMLDFLDLLRGDKSIEIVKSTNRFRNPTLSGYRDWNLQLKISTKDGITKHICELQLHHRVIKDASEVLGSLDYYRFFREYFVGATGGAMEDRMNDLRPLCDGGSLNLASLWCSIQNPLETDRMIRLAELFENHVHDYQLAMIITNVIRTCLEPAVLYTTLGRLFQKQMDLEEARIMYQKSLEVRLKELGPGHADTVQTYICLATVLRNEGKLDQAIIRYEKALDIRLQELGPDHATTAEMYSSLAVTYTQQGKLDQAIIRYQKALGIRLQALGPDHTTTGETYNSLAVMYARQGKLDEAIAMSQKAMSIKLMALGPDHSSTANTKALVEWMHSMKSETWEEVQQA
ncbi:unnamed protein product [Cylindrotheca closterium]|uniref:Kinesin light chain n=1 Tax=Cylindrotheca closterium TaxID=2856 RepID=A0AAD2CBD2_9STRA|nr:unnamed protein product [Cylindrotheca closterium]